MFMQSFIKARIINDRIEIMEKANTFLPGMSNKNKNIVKV